MKKVSIILFLTVGIISCGGGSGSPKHIENKAPTAPTLIYPSNNLLCVDNMVDFSWNASVDPDGDDITYEIVIAKDSQFSTIVKIETTTVQTISFNLDKGMPYYWKVKAVDTKYNASNYTTSWGFYTAGEAVVNYVPFAATLKKPELNEIVSSVPSVILEWEASDLDNDPLKYDLYLGTSKTFTTPVLQDITAKNVTKTGLSQNTTYYWRIDVKDSKGAKTIGQVWNFKTS